MSPVGEEAREMVEVRVVMRRKAGIMVARPKFWKRKPTRPMLVGLVWFRLLEEKLVGGAY